MTEPGDVLDLAPLGVPVEILKAAAQTDGESLEIEVVRSARGLLAQSHVHALQVERLEVVEGCSSSGSTVASTGWARARRWRSRPARRTASARALKGPAACGSRSAQRGGTEEFLRRLAQMSAASTSSPEAGRGRWPAPRWCSISPTRATPRLNPATDRIGPAQVRRPFRS